MNQIKSIVSIATIKKIAISFMFLFFSGAFSYISALDVDTWDGTNGLKGVYHIQLGPGIIGNLLNDIDQGSSQMLLGLPGGLGGIIEGNNFALVGGSDFGTYTSVFEIGGIGRQITFQNITFKEFKNYYNGVMWGREDSSITFTGSNIIFKDNYGWQGTSLYLEGASFFTANIVSFTNNTAVDGGEGGAALRLSGGASRTIFGAADILFSNNTAVKNGGAIYAQGGAYLLFDGSNVTFSNNWAFNNMFRDSKGGAIYIEDAKMEFKNAGNISFSNNTAIINDSNAQSAGAIYAYGASMLFSGPVEFSNNIVVITNTANNRAAGAIYAYASSISFVDSSALFLGNMTSINVGVLSAGSVFVDNVSTLSFTRSTVSFSDGGRGANSDIYSQDSAVIIRDSSLIFLYSRADFYNNISTTPAEGGAALRLFRIAAGNKSFMSAEGSQINFTNNTAQNGGALYISQNSSITIRRSYVNFENNSAISSGGALFASDSAKIYFFDSTVSFLGNNAEFLGDALYLANTAEINFINGLVSFNNYGDENSPNNIWFLENSAKLDFSSGSVEGIGNKAIQGAFLNLSNKTYSFGRNVNFVSNIARDYGGAFYMNNAKAYFGTGKDNFVENSASSGGAIYAIGRSIISFSASTAIFSQNTAQYGGAVFLLNSFMGSSRNASMIFDGNNSENSAIYAQGSSITFIGSSTFSNNYSISSGAAFYLLRSTLSLSGLSASFLYNITDNNGAAVYQDIGSKIDISVSTLTVVGNSAQTNADGSGGAFYFVSNSSSTISASVMNFAYNIASSSGGAIYISAGSTISVSGSGIFENNSASAGGAIYNEGFLILDSRVRDMKFIDNSASGQQNDIYNSASSTISITGASGSVEINSGIDGGGWIIKTGRGALTINVENAFYGVFIQKAGTTTFTQNSKMFIGTNTIETSLLKLTSDGQDYFDLTIGVSGIFEYYNTTDNSFTISSTNIRFNSSGGIARFNKDSSLGVMTAYLIADDIGNANQNTVEFYNANAVFGSTSYQKGTRYVFSASSINLTASGIPNEVKTTSFSYLETKGNEVYLTFGLYVDASSRLYTDVLYSLISTGRVNVKNIAIYKETPGLLPDVDTYIEFSTRVLTGSGALAFNPITQWTNIVTDNYQYIITVDISTSWINVIFARPPEDSLNIINMMQSSTWTRTYLTKIIAKLNPTTSTYHILGDLGVAGVGTFLVSSASLSSGGVSSVSGLSRIDQTTKGSFFKLANDTALTIDRLSIFDAYASGLDPSTAPASGSVINMTNAQASALLRDTNFSYNTAQENGGAIYATAGILKIEAASRTVSVSNNSAFQSGGVIYLSNAKSTISARRNIEFFGNEAQENGGVFYADNAQIYFANVRSTSNISFLSNSAASGGAFYLQDSELFFAATNTVSNNAAFGSDGGAFYANRSKALFTNLRANWTNNTAYGSGGIFYILASSFNFNNIHSSALTGNTAVSGSGGAFYIQYSSVSFNNASISQTLSLSGADGGAFYISDSRVNFNNSSMSWTNSYAGGSGGAFYVSNSTVNFSGSASWLNTTAASNGGVFSAQSSRLAFSNRSLSFNNSFSASNGGVFYLQDSIASISSRASFENNRSAGAGGVFYLDNSSLSFNNTQSLFSNNTAALDGGAFYLQNSKLSIINGSAVFTNISAQNGAAFYLNSSTLNFSSVSVSFSNVKASAEGNIIYAQDSFMNLIMISSGINSDANTANSDIWLSNSNLTIQVKRGSTIRLANGISAQNSSFIKKEAGEIRINKTFSFNAGAFSAAANNRIIIDAVADFNYNASSSIALSGGGMYFSASKVSFTNNSSDINGGALSLSASSVTFTNSPATFSNNSAYQSGGAIYIEAGGYASFNSAVFDYNRSGSYQDGGALYIKGSSARIVNTKFANNFAGRGGAIYAENSNLELIDVEFSGNQADLQDGSALYLNNSIMLLTTNKDFVSFVREQDGNKYVYLTGGSQLTIDTKKAAVEINNQIYADGADTLKKQGSGSLTVDSVEFIDSASKLTIEEGKFYFTAVSLKVGILEIKGGSYFKLEKDSRRTIYVRQLNIEDGTLEMGVYIDALSRTINSDSIMDLETAVISVNSKTNPTLIANFHGDISNIDMEDPNQRKIKYLDFGGLSPDYSGYFKWYSSPGLSGYRISSTKDSDGVYLVITPLQQVADASYNERALQNLFSQIDGGTDIAVYLRNSIDDWITENSQKAKKALGQMSGGFYANSLRMGAMSAASAVIYPRIQKVNKDETMGDIIKSIWVGGNINAFSNDSSENAVETFESNAYGISAGFNVFTQKDSLVGIYMSYTGNSLTQGLDKAEMSDVGIGAYGGSFSTDLSIRWNLGMAFLNYDFNRTVELKDNSLNPKSSIGAQSVKGGIEIEIIRVLQNQFLFKPFAGIQGAIAFNGDIKEKNGDYANLVVDSNQYLRMMGMLGAKITKGDEAGQWFVKAGLNYLLTSNKAEYNIGFESEAGRMKIISNEENPLSFTVGAGFETIIWGSVSAYVNIDARLASDIREYIGNFGLNFRFDKTNKEVLAEFKDKSENMQAQMSAEALLKKQMRDLEVELLKQKIRLEEEVETPISEEELREQVKAELETQKAQEAQRAQEAQEAQRAQEAMQLQQAMQQTPLFNNIEQQKTADTGSEPSISSLDARLSVVELGMTVNAGENVAPQSQFQSRQTFIEEEDDEEIRTLDDNALNAEIAQAQSRKSNSSAAKSAIRAFSLSAATFRPGSFDLTDAAKRAINRLANEIKKRPYKKIVIEGHTDASGDIQKNLVLSHKRAREVRKELYKNGIPLNKMAYIGFGPTMPIAANNTDLGRSKNRRVEIYVE